MNGGHEVSEIREEGYDKKIIAFTTLNEKEFEKSELKKYVDGFVPQPYSSDQLLDVIESIIS
jgi:CheY-like chemotaxis protein